MIVIDLAIAFYIMGVIAGLFIVAAMWADAKWWQRIAGILGCFVWFLIILLAVKRKK
jgi:hypothetical protein